MQIPIKYIVAAVLFGLVISFGMMSLSYKPQPVQVQVNQYEPVQRVPVVVPTAKPTEAFTPAPAPVVVTTEPLPTIIPVPVPAEPAVASDTCPGKTAWMMVIYFISIAVGLYGLMLLFQSYIEGNNCEDIGSNIGIVILIALLELGLPMFARVVNIGC